MASAAENLEQEINDKEWNIDNPKNAVVANTGLPADDNESSTVQAQLDNIRHMLDTVEKRGTHNMSNSENKELKGLKKRLMQIYIEEDKKTDDQNPKKKQEKLRLKQERTAYKKTGGIPKMAKYHPDNLLISEKEYDASGSSESDDGSITSTGHSAQDSHKLRSRQASHSNSQNDILRALVDKIDNRPVPKHENFDEKTGQSMKDFLESFEKYCSNYYKGDTKLWLNELENKLSGETLRAFRYHRSHNEDFISMKYKLIQWYDDVKYDRKQKYKTDFTKLKYSKDESLYLFSIKVEKAYKLAYPKGNVENSSTLRDQFLKTVPTSFKRAVNAQIFSDNVNKRPILWDTIQRCARFKDLENQNNNSEDSDGNEKVAEEIVINLQEGKRAQGYEPNKGNNQQNYNSRQFNNQEGCQCRCNQQNQKQQQNQGSNRGFQQNQNNNRDNQQNQNNNRVNQQNQNSNRGQSQNYPAGNNSNQQRDQNRPYCQFCNNVGHTFDNCRKRLSSQTNNGNTSCCRHCGHPGHNYDNCKRRQGLCFACGQRGHIRRECNNRQNQSGGNYNQGGENHPNYRQTAERQSGNSSQSGRESREENSQQPLN